MTQHKKLFSKWQYVLSFITPITLLKEKKTKHTLKLQLVNGILQLNTTNANYTLGENHTAWKNILTSINIKKNADILILGFGAGSIANILKDFNPNSITGVEIDKTIIQWANKFFSEIIPQKTKIINSDAFEFINENNNKYDLICVDLFYDIYLPEKLLSKENIIKIISKNKPEGITVINSLILNNKTKKQNWKLHQILNNINNIKFTTQFIGKHEFFIIYK